MENSQQTETDGSAAPTDTVTSTSSPADTIPFDQGQAKSNLDRAWEKVQDALHQEAEGNNLWIEGTLELIKILDDARKRLGPDQEFGKWLTENSYGEDRLKRNDRQALQNMALDLAVTREVLAQTHRRSWRLIWEQEIQPRLHSPVQPPDLEAPKEEQPPASEAPQDGQPAGDETKTRRPRKRNGTRNQPPKEEWGKDLNAFLSDSLLTANAFIRIKKGIQGCKPEKQAELKKKVTPKWLDEIAEGRKAVTWIYDWANGLLDEEADKHIQEGRVVETLASASEQVRPEA
jgi:hypothetical protein